MQILLYKYYYNCKYKINFQIYLCKILLCEFSEAGSIFRVIKTWSSSSFEQDVKKRNSYISKFYFCLELTDSLIVYQVNNDPNILPNVKLVMRWTDTRGETTEATSAMIDMLCEGVVAFFGPEGSCHVEAIVAQSRNVPMLSYVSKLYIFFIVNVFLTWFCPLININVH